MDRSEERRFVITNKYLLTTDDFRVIYNKNKIKLITSGGSKMSVDHSFENSGGLGVANTLTINFSSPQRVIELFGPNPIQGEVC